MTKYFEHLYLALVCLLLQTIRPTTLALPLHIVLLEQSRDQRWLSGHHQASWREENMV